MADAGLLQNGAGTVHWTTLPAFAERHHNISARDALFVTSNDVTSTPGEAAALDMVIAFIQRHVSDDLTQQLCAQLMISFPRLGNTDQPREQTGFLRGAPPKLRQILDLMSNHLEDPLLVRDITARVGLSMRQTERLFAAHLDHPPKAYYRKLRLQHGRLLIEHTSMSILEISLATGFSNRRIFSKYYRHEFGFPPSHTRRAP
jgi:transcriptional regulator GlxA family with amidase domain